MMVPIPSPPRPPGMRKLAPPSSLRRSSTLSLRGNSSRRIFRPPTPICPRPGHVPRLYPSSKKNRHHSMRIVIRSVIGNRSPRLLARHHALHQSGDDCEDRASGAAADDLTHESADIEPTPSRRAGDRRNQGLKNLTAADPADGAGDGVTEIAKIVVLQRGAGGVSANDSRDELNDQVDDRFHGCPPCPLQSD